MFYERQIHWMKNPAVGENRLRKCFVCGIPFNFRWRNADCNWGVCMVGMSESLTTRRWEAIRIIVEVEMGFNVIPLLKFQCHLIAEASTLSPPTPYIHCTAPNHPPWQPTETEEWTPFRHPLTQTTMKHPFYIKYWRKRENGAKIVTKQWTPFKMHFIRHSKLNIDLHSYFRWFEFQHKRCTTLWAKYQIVNDAMHFRWNGTHAGGEPVPLTVLVMVSVAGCQCHCMHLHCKVRGYVSVPRHRQTLYLSSV